MLLKLSLNEHREKYLWLHDTNCSPRTLKLKSLAAGVNFFLLTFTAESPHTMIIVQKRLSGEKEKISEYAFPFFTFSD